MATMCGKYFFYELCIFSVCRYHRRKVCHMSSIVVCGVILSWVLIMNLSRWNIACMPFICEERKFASTPTITQKLNSTHQPQVWFPDINPM